jgi:hypothetical protein
VKWRFWDYPLGKYGEYYAYREGRLQGYAVTKRFENPSGIVVGVIVEVFVALGDEESFVALVRAGVADMMRAGVDVLKCSFTSAWARARMRRAGFLDPKQLLPEKYVPGRLVFAATSVAVPTSLEEWWLTRGDSEQDFNDATRGSKMLPAFVGAPA